jgi:hypothetical protein
MWLLLIMCWAETIWLNSKVCQWIFVSVLNSNSPQSYVDLKVNTLAEPGLELVTIGLVGEHATTSAMPPPYLNRYSGWNSGEKKHIKIKNQPFSNYQRRTFNQSKTLGSHSNHGKPDCPNFWTVMFTIDTHQSKMMDYCIEKKFVFVSVNCVALKIYKIFSTFQCLPSEILFFKPKHAQL